MKLRRESLLLKKKAISSMRRAASSFNAFDDDGRITTVLLHMQHAFEMLLKAGLVQNRQRVFDPRSGRSIGFEKCVELSRQHLAVTSDEAGTLRTLDALRDNEQHWMAETSEGLLYLHCRASVTLFDDLLHRWFDERLASYLPHRVLPISAEPPRDIQLLLEEEYEQIGSLLAPGKRKRPDARARIRALLAMEAHVADEEVHVSERDVDRVERAIKKGGRREQVFPRLSEIGTDVAGKGVLVKVRFSKTEGVPVRFVGADDDVAAEAIRDVDLQRKYHWTAMELAKKLGLTRPRSVSLRRHLGIDDDPRCRHDFVFGSQTHLRFSDNAYTKMRDALADGLDMDEVWRNHNPNRRRTVDSDAA